MEPDILLIAKAAMQTAHAQKCPTPIIKWEKACKDVGHLHDVDWATRRHDGSCTLLVHL